MLGVDDRTRAVTGIPLDDLDAVEYSLIDDSELRLVIPAGEPDARTP